MVVCISYTEKCSMYWDAESFWVSVEFKQNAFDSVIKDCRTSYKISAVLRINSHQISTLRCIITPSLYAIGYTIISKCHANENLASVSQMLLSVIFKNEVPKDVYADTVRCFCA